MQIHQEEFVVLRPSMPDASPYTPEVRGDPRLALAAQMLSCHGEIRLELRGASMLPTLWPGDLLTIKSVAHDEIVPGDVVLVMRDNRFFAHRLIKKQQGRDCRSWVTKGDAVPQNDALVAPSELLGRIVLIGRGNRNFVPGRRVSLLHSALARMLCRWDRARGLALRMHAVRLQACATHP